MVHPKFNLNISFLHFHLPTSKFCWQTYLSLHVPVSTRDMFPRVYGLIYCGHRMPWRCSFQKSHATARYFTQWGLVKGYYFVMTFEAFDIRSQSIAYIHRGECLYNRENYNWILLERNPDFNLIKTEFQILFYATVVQQIILKYPATPQFSCDPFYKDLPDYFYNLSDVRVYDGPGIKSPRVLPTCNASTEYCIEYFTYLVIRVS